MNPSLRQTIGRLQRFAGSLGLAGLALALIGLLVFRLPFYHSYLFAYLFWFDVTLGCLLVAMLHHLTGGRWGFVTRRIYEAGFMTMPLMLFLFVPIFFGLDALYPWAGSAVPPATGEVARHKQLYLTLPGFTLRALGYFAVWLTIAVLLRKWSLAQDHTSDPGPTRRMRKLSGPGLVITALIITGANIDWVMSLEPKWYSTIFGVIIMSGQVLMAFVWSVFALAFVNRGAPDSPLATSLHFHQLGKLLLTFVMFWTYVSFSQLLIIWSGNLPHEISWYLHRIAGTWKWLIAAVVLFHFFLPFLLLLSREAKQHVRVLVALSAILFLAHAGYVYWLVAPSIHKTGFRLTWIDLALFVGIGGVWIAVFLQALKRAALVPRNDPRMEMEVAHASE